MDSTGSSDVPEVFLRHFPLVSPFSPLHVVDFSDFNPGRLSVPEFLVPRLIPSDGGRTLKQEYSDLHYAYPAPGEEHNELAGENARVCVTSPEMTFHGAAQMRQSGAFSFPELLLRIHDEAFGSVFNSIEGFLEDCVSEWYAAQVRLARALDETSSGDAGSTSCGPIPDFEKPAIQRQLWHPASARGAGSAGGASAAGDYSSYKTVAVAQRVLPRDAPANAPRPIAMAVQSYIPEHLRTQAETGRPHHFAYAELVGEQAPEVRGHIVLLLKSLMWDHSKKTIFVNWVVDSMHVLGLGPSRGDSVSERHRAFRAQSAAAAGAMAGSKLLSHLVGKMGAALGAAVPAPPSVTDFHAVLAAAEAADPPVAVVAVPAPAEGEPTRKRLRTVTIMDLPPLSPPLVPFVVGGSPPPAPGRPATTWRTSRLRGPSAAGAASPSVGTYPARASAEAIFPVRALRLSPSPSRVSANPAASSSSTSPAPGSLSSSSAR